MNSLISSVDILKEAERRLSSEWAVAKEIWNDSASQEFEKSFWSEFETITAESIQNLEQLIASIDQAEREVP